MKKLLRLIPLLFLSLQAPAQVGKIDTVKVGITLKVVDWYLAQSVLAKSGDTLELAESWKIKDAVLASNRLLATEVFVDSLPGQLLIWFYRKVETMTRAQSRLLGDRIYTRIRAITHPVLQYHIGQFDAVQQAQIEGELKEGRWQTLRDQ